MDKNYLINHYKSYFNIESINIKNISITKLNGGISNLMYKLEYNNKPIIIRIYGKYSNNLINRSNEINNHITLSNYNIAPKILKLFEIGRIEEFISGKSLNSNKSYKYINEISNMMKYIHKIKMGNNKIIIWDRLIKTCGNFKNNTSKYLKKIYNMKKKINNFNKNNSLLDIVFCHNDLIPSNIMINEKKIIKFIDFEYSGYNYRGFDIAIHMYGYLIDNNIDETFFTKVKNFLILYLDKNPSSEDMNIIYFFLKIHILMCIIWAINNTNSDILFDKAIYIDRRLEWFNYIVKYGY